MLDSLEVSYLANRDDNLHFCLLTDFTDCDYETAPTDEALITHASKAIIALNDKYRTSRAGNKIAPFLLLHRPRRWNAQEKLWMGYERKRGKLSDLNALLRKSLHAQSSTLFSVMIGDVEALSSVKYVITLDTDTQLPRDSAHQLVATIAHPLNKAKFDQNQAHVTEGYAYCNLEWLQVCQAQVRHFTKSCVAVKQG